MVVSPTIFISPVLVSTLQLPVFPTTDYGIFVGGGACLPGSGVCKGVRMSFQGLDIMAYFFPIGMQGHDLILGVKWLSTIGVTTIKWQKLTLSFDSKRGRLLPSEVIQLFIMLLYPASRYNDPWTRGGRYFAGMLYGG
ncbi:hypothetical protein Scep_025812 [Stephania cephalantha]|uniref:Uncharacterized protein n=1 Tax=Stephania cephalantha TaxID=152367 RepID=A0AAP0ER79_9MAGN